MIMPTSRECICCCEVGKVVMKKEESASEISCITDREGFQSVCFNVWGTHTISTLTVTQ